ncbi:hypothetical protein OC835_008028, partial [Tilletia horrida]
TILTTANVKILYVNVRGLDWQKRVHLFDQADESTLIFAAETWHTASVGSGPFPLLANTEEARVRGKDVLGRRHGGLALWAGAAIQPLISNIQTSRYSITVTIHRRVIHAVYLPPTLDKGASEAHSVKAYLRPPDRSIPDILIGDINTRFGKRFGDRESGPQARLRVVRDLCREQALTHHVPAPDSPSLVTVDHLFTRPGISAVLKARWLDKEKLSTDHPLLEVYASWSKETPTEPSAPAAAAHRPSSPLDPTVRPTERLQ